MQGIRVGLNRKSGKKIHILGLTRLIHLDTLLSERRVKINVSIRVGIKEGLLSYCQNR